MKRFRSALGAMAAAMLVAACGSDTQTAVINDSTARGTLVEDPPLRIASLNAADFGSELGSSTTGQQLLQLTGAPTCGVDFYYLKFYTVGAAGEVTMSSGALMVPTATAATAASCSGPRPIVLYAHGTQADQTFNIADITNTSNTEGAEVAAMFAAQGYIVVAPNYAGYDISTLGYHPFVNASQQSGEMIDILAAARTALPKTFASATTDSGKLFVTGYSEGGFVAMATQQALQAAGTPPTAVAPGSGPYALEAFGDAIFTSHVDIGSTEFAPLITSSYQHAYGNIYSSPTDVYSSTYPNAATLLPSTTPIATLYTDGDLPELALFDSTPPNSTSYPSVPPEVLGLMAVPTPNPADPATEVWFSGFGNPYLITNDYRVSYVGDLAGNPDGSETTPATYKLPATAPTQTLRNALYKNDMRNGGWVPEEPTLLCGGENDPTVFFATNTQVMEAYWTAVVPAPAGALNVLDVDPATPSGPFIAIQQAFQAAEAATLTELMSTGLTQAEAEQEAIASYHTGVAPFCALAARSFFDSVLAQ